MITRLENGKPKNYIKRHYILQLPFMTVLLHQFWTSDPDDLHDHPWSNIKIRIKGSYYEYDAQGNKFKRDKWYVGYRQAEVFHRIEVDPGMEGKVWSLFVHFKRKRAWGFLKGNKWIPASEYENPVEVHGRNFKIEGTFFPRYVKLGA